MGAELLLIVILSILVILLGIILSVRIASEKRQHVVLRRMNIVEFADFLRTNSVEGNIQAVAGKVSTLLSNTFGCDRIIFLRKKRGALELNFYRGIDKFNRKDFSLPYREELGQKLSSDFLPAKLEKLRSVVPQEFYRLLNEFEVDVYFPIYWRNNLYGIYFVKSNLEIRTPEFTLLVASLAQSLSAAYHIKWHETRLANLEKRMDASHLPPSRLKESTGEKITTDAEFLSLLNIRDTNLLIPKIVGRLGEELKFKKYNFVFGGFSDHDSTRSVSSGGERKELLPDKASLESLAHKIRGRGVQKIDEIEDSSPEIYRWLEELRKSGLEYITEFQLTNNRSGVLGFSGSAPSSATQTTLQNYRRISAELIENAEAYKQAEVMSYTDTLTELSNQRYMYKRLEEEINRARRHSRPLAFIILDVDELKTVNDTYGHLAGDALLKQVGQTLKKSIRANDVVARYGGDEFCVVMPEADKETCVKFMERMLQIIAGSNINLPGVSRPSHCSVSMGAALFPEHAQKAEKLVYAADMALLKAKSGGRNRYLFYTPQEAASQG